MYSNVLATCIKSTAMETTDYIAGYKQFKAEQWVGYSRLRLAGGDAGVKYFGGACSGLLPGQCDKTTGCGWNKGKKGYNDYTLGGTLIPRYSLMLRE
jgi:hypothetical protein